MSITSIIYTIISGVIVGLMIYGVSIDRKTLKSLRKTIEEEKRLSKEFVKKNTIVVNNIYSLIFASYMLEDADDILEEYIKVLFDDIKNGPRYVNFHKTHHFQAIDMLIGAKAVHMSLRPEKYIDNIDQE